MSVQNPEPARPRVLIADDDAATRMIVKRVLEQDGFEVMEAPDGRAALECFERSPPDIVLLDVQMPYLDGYAVCRRIREAESGVSTPVCMVTGLEDAESVNRAYQAGATDFISKPIPWTVLGHRLRYLLRASGALNELLSLVLALPDSVFILDAEGQPLASALDTGISAGGKPSPLGPTVPQRALPDTDPKTIKEFIRQALETGEQQVYEHCPDDTTGQTELRFVPRDKHSVLAIMRDITERKQAEARIHDLAFYDHLTGLPNRELFSQQLDKIIGSGAGEQGHCAMLFLDLDNFKRINDTLGHATGDQLLKTVASRLKQCVRPADVVMPSSSESRAPASIARLGGDEFVVVLRGVSSEAVAASVATRITRALGEPMQCAGHQFVVTPSIGIALYPRDGQTSEELLSNADAAMYRAKLSGRNTFSFFSESMKVQALNRLNMENELRQAIEAGDFELHFQPKVDVKSWTIVGAEALLRWKHASFGAISPATFIPVAEDTGLILPLGKWVLNQACRQLATWHQSGLDSISMAVNVSGHQMHASDLVDVVKQALHDSGVDPAMLEVEITESFLMKDTDASIARLKALRAVGVRISLDDFGTGYSSLSYLKRFPIDTLKIDRSFVGDLHCDSDDAAICAAILSMSRQLGLSVVAEGVELQEQLEFLKQHNCEQIQGYLFSKPLPAKAFEALVREHNSGRGQTAQVLSLPS